jgi:segregation and condensation protein B
VDVGGIVRLLLEKNLIKILGRKNVPGRPIIYGTTQKFLEFFSLKDISSLPTLEEMGELIEEVNPIGKYTETA